MTDARLIELARRGDQSAFGTLVERHHQAAYRTALAVCRSHEEADEVAQDAMVQAWRRLDSFRGAAQFKTWLLTITWRLALARRRGLWSRLRHVVQPDADRPLDPPAGIASAEQRVADAQLLEAVREELRTLPAKFRQPLLLAMSGDCTFEEMAVVLGTRSGTLKWRVMEARRRLKTQLAARGFEWP